MLFWFIVWLLGVVVTFDLMRKGIQWSEKVTGKKSPMIDVRNWLWLDWLCVVLWPVTWIAFVCFIALLLGYLAMRK